MARILVLTDYRNQFGISIEKNIHGYVSMNVEKMAVFFRQRGHSIEVISFSNLDLSQSYKDCFVIYQSSEDIGGFYKDYIKDILFYLEMQGAILLPRFQYFLAHHNKNFMELLRKSFSYSGFKTIDSKLFGTADEALDEINEFPVVLKSAEGYGSYGVFLAQNRHQFKRCAKLLSRIFMLNRLSDIKTLLLYFVPFPNLRQKLQIKHRLPTLYRKKFIVQNFIKNLKGDYKVLFFGGKYYTLYRKNRDDDFRASGSGKFSSVADDEIPGLLDFCRKLTFEVAYPIIGMDVGYDGSQYHLLEFQFVHLGPYTLQNSAFWHEYANGS